MFRSGETDPAALSERIAAAVEKSHGLRPDVMVLEKGEFRRAADGSPYPRTDAQSKTVHLSFLAEAPPQPDLVQMDAVKSPTEEFALKGRVFYLHAPAGIGRSNLAARAERLLGVPATARNWRTITKILELAEGLPDRS